jgi:hypothetical protein
VKGDDWTMAHATRDESLPPAIRSRCSGTFRVTENDGKRPAVLECDGCGDVVTVRQGTLRREAPARPTEAIPF